MTESIRSIQSHFVVLSPDKRATIEPNDASLYERLDRDYRDFKGYELIACHEFENDWPTWEIHPHGDEVVLLLSGDATLVLDVEGEHRSARLDQPGAYIVVPKNTWHTARVHGRTQMLFITPGEGTLNEVRESGPGSDHAEP